MADEKKIIPEQRVGNQLDTFHEYEGKSEDDARSVFSMAANRLAHVNTWEKICGPLSAKFELTDEHGNPVQREVRPGDHFKIDVPGPGPSAGDGYDWVRVEEIDDRRNPNASEEHLVIRVRPAPSPINKESDTAHFFDEKATSSFVVKRQGTLVRSEVHGRNEVPNASIEKNSDKVRNAVVGSGAIAGGSKPQWKSLVKGLLDSSIDTDEVA